MPTERMFRPELQKSNDSQPLEWPVSYDLGTTMEKCLYSDPMGMSYLALPGARLPQPGYRERAVNNKTSGQTRKNPGPTPSRDWLFSNGSMPKVRLPYTSPSSKLSSGLSLFKN